MRGRRQGVPCPALLGVPPPGAAARRSRRSTKCGAPQSAPPRPQVGNRLRVDGTLMGLDDARKAFIPKWKRGRFTLLVNGGEAAIATGKGGGQAAKAWGWLRPAAAVRELRKPHPPTCTAAAPLLRPAAAALAGVSPTAAYLVDHTTRTYYDL